MLYKYNEFGVRRHSKNRAQSVLTPFGAEITISRGRRWIQRRQTGERTPAGARSCLATLPREQKKTGPRRSPFQPCLSKPGEPGVELEGVDHAHRDDGVVAAGIARQDRVACASARTEHDTGFRPSVRRIDRGALGQGGVGADRPLGGLMTT